MPQGSSRSRRENRASEGGGRGFADVRRDASLEAVVAAGVVGQLAHAGYQLLLATFLGGAAWLALAGVGFVAAVAVAVATVLAVRGTTAEFGGDCERRSTTRSGDGAPVAPASDAPRAPADVGAPSDRPVDGAATPDGGVAAAGDPSTDEVASHLQSYAGVIDAAGDGDLTRRLDEDVTGDDLARLAAEFNEMVAAFERTIEAAGEFSADVAGSSEQVTAATEAIEDASGNLAESVQEIAHVFRDQHGQISRISDEMEDMSTTIEEIASSAEEVTEMADMTERRTVEGMEAGECARDVMDETMERTEAVVDTVETLDERMDEVGQIVDLIDDIAEQTNILALNASIEAAHAATGAGTESDGFTVVADEVKSLAGETKAATDRIERLIGDIRAQTDETVQEIGAVRDSVEEGRATVEEGLSSLESIMDHVQRTSSGVREISNSTDQQAATSEEVASIADETATTSRENVEEAERVASIAEEQNLALSEMHVNVKMLSLRARQLSTLFENYETTE